MNEHICVKMMMIDQVIFIMGEIVNKRNRRNKLTFDKTMKYTIDNEHARLWSILIKEKKDKKELICKC